MKRHGKTAPAAVPAATYRLQLNRDLPFGAAADLAPYLRKLGVSHLYTSPILQARSGSGHGYDGVDPTRINRELGGESGFADFSTALLAEHLGLLLDIVPNHLCVVGGENAWWQDVLTHGRGSPHAAVFDIDWHSPDRELAGRVLVPFLGRPLAELLSAGDLGVVLENGVLAVAYYEHRWPLSPHSWPLLLEPPAARGDLAAATRRTLRGMVAAARRFGPPHRTRRPLAAARLRAFNALRERLDGQYAENEEFHAALAAELKALNAEVVQAPGGGRWPALLQAQAWLATDWQAASERLNYRRFFDITELAGLRQEDPRVFAATHDRVLALTAQGAVQGLRIDHPDGLADPGGYLRRLRRAVSAARGPEAGAYIVVEKILEPGERRRSDWPVEGGTGYDMLYRINAVQVDDDQAAEFRAAYARCTGDAEPFAEHVAEGKRLVLDSALSGDLQRLARSVSALARQTDAWDALPTETWQEALAALAVAMPVYRTYVTKGRPASAEDAQWLAVAVAEVKRRHHDLDPALLDWLAELLRDPARVFPEARREAQAFVTRFQQLTGAVMAKGLEDTAYYRYVPLVSLNEVGGDPGAFGMTPAAFHAWNERRARRWPHALSATDTHDTKRGEGVRARLNALSEQPSAWEAAFRRWQAMNARFRADVGGVTVPEPLTEYLIYQTLVGAWPLAGRDDPEWDGFDHRIVAYLEKAIREAKRHTRWTAPDPGYEAAVRQFVHAILAETLDNAFPEDMEAFLPPVMRAGLNNALSQTVLKIALPGVPDFYQGTELWNFSLVDPDNRRPVDFAKRRALLDALPAEPSPAMADELLASASDGRVKLYTIRQGLALRNAHKALFALGGYRPLNVEGLRARHALAFARVRGRESVVTVVGRLYMGLPGGGSDSGPVRLPVGDAVWDATWAEIDASLPTGAYRDAFTGRILTAVRREGRWSLSVAEALRHLPVALLEHLP